MRMRKRGSSLQVKRLYRIPSIAELNRSTLLDLIRGPSLILISFPIRADPPDPRSSAFHSSTRLFCLTSHRARDLVMFPSRSVNWSTLGERTRHIAIGPDAVQRERAGARGSRGSLW